MTYAGVAELADAPDLGSGGRPWGFESLHPQDISPQTLQGSAGFCYTIEYNLRKERENVDGFFNLNICGIFYHISDLLLYGAEKNALGSAAAVQFAVLCVVSALSGDLSAV